MVPRLIGRVQSVHRRSRAADNSGTGGNRGGDSSSLLRPGGPPIPDPPEWWEEAFEFARATHEPSQFDGREWRDLTPAERENAVQEAVIEIGVFE